ncbi:hypothetical protein BJV77DRAFT_259315 [Russula vinacea]|nr:hypothetical protein BJV77DRAFT_259315 [Russula vinacea]
MFRYISYPVSPSFHTLHPSSPRRILPSAPHTHTPPRESMSAAGYDLQRGQFDLSPEFEQEAPPYLPKAPPPTYSSTYRPCFSPLAMDPPSQYVPHDHHLPTPGGELSPGAGPRDTRLSGFDLAESIWSQNSDLTLDDLALSFDSTSSQSRSSMSSHWSAPR